MLIKLWFTLFTVFCAFAADDHSASSWGDRYRNASKLYCMHNGKPSMSFYEGEGAGCGQYRGSRTKIATQQVDHQASEIVIETKNDRQIREPRCQFTALGCKPVCAYWGPIYTLANLKVLKGKWKVIVDGVYIGTYIYALEGDEKSDSCEVIASI